MRGLRRLKPIVVGGALATLSVLRLTAPVGQSQNANPTPVFEKNRCIYEGSALVLTDMSRPLCFLGHLHSREYATDRLRRTGQTGLDPPLRRGGVLLSCRAEPRVLLLRDGLYRFRPAAEEQLYALA
jgi:hypothetical protein